MKLENAKQIFKALPENEKLSLIEKAMPHSGTHRQLDNSGYWSDGQIVDMARLFVNSIHWEKGIEIEKICVHDKLHVVNGESDLGNSYEGVGYYCDGKFIDLEDLECINYPLKPIRL